MDPGSDRSYVLKGVAQDLNLQLGKKVRLECSSFLQGEAQTVEMNEVMISLYNKNNLARTYRFTVTPCIAGELQTAPDHHFVTELLPQHLTYADADLFSNRRRPIEMLIGNDIYHEVVNVTQSRILSHGFVLLSSFFGWIPSGKPQEERQSSSTMCTMTLLADPDQKLVKGKVLSPLEIPPDVSDTTADDTTQTGINESELEKLWSLELIGIEHPDKHLVEERALELFRKSLYREPNGRYVVRLPWKDKTTPLPSNYRMAVARLKSVLLRSSTAKLLEVDQIIQDQLKEHIIEEAPIRQNVGSASKSDEVHRIHYLPHRWVQEKTKIRVVYDASAKTKTGISLNDLVYKGQNLTRMMIAQLINFRLHPVAISADIKGAYLQIGLNEVDRDATRFLWVNDLSLPIEGKNNIRYLRFARVPFGVNASPFLLNMVLQERFAAEPPSELSTMARENFYVDNFIVSVSSVVKAINVFEYMTAKLNDMQMNLRDWATNNDQFLSIIPMEKRHREDSSKSISILGLVWDRQHDTLACKLNVNLPLEGTKRNVLRFLASIYDPLNLLAPSLLELRIFLRKCWKNKLDWNTPLPKSLLAEWCKLRIDALEIPKVAIPRHYWSGDEPGKYELHVFCDASQEAYACCAYLVFKPDNNLQIKTSLIFGKNRLSPPKSMSIPRLELLGVLIGKRTAEFLTHALQIDLTRTILWMNATTVLQWLNSAEILQVFVQNRINELRSAKSIEYRYVPGSDNPADYATRGKPVRILQNLPNWWHGPSWLVHEALWPKPPINVLNYQWTQSKSTTVCVTGQREMSLLNDRIEKGMSSWNSRVRVFRNIIKFCIIGSKLPLHATDTHLLKLAENLLIAELQHKYFYKELKLLKKGIQPPTNLDLFIPSDERNEDGSIKKRSDKIMRCGGRLQHANLGYDGIHPILLPRESPATESLIRMIHVNQGHVGASHVLSKLRERFWIVKARARINSVIHRCVICRRWKGKSYTPPPIPPIPAARVDSCSPFLHIGIDHFGPFMTREKKGELEKSCQVLIFACLVTRAVHLELVPDLIGEHVFLALNRFSSLRRVPQFIISDNAKCFQFVQPLVGIKVQISDYHVRRYIDNNRVEWYFIPQYAPWYGAAYERLIGIVKRSFYTAVSKRILPYEEMRTVLFRVMDIVNDRPLTYVPSEEIIRPLTPNHFLRLGPANVNMTLEMHPRPPRTETGKLLADQWRKLNHMLDVYWERFRHEYLTSLRERHSVELKKTKGSLPIIPSPGDVVLVADPHAPRNEWVLGVIHQVDRRQAVAHVTTIKPGTLFDQSVQKTTLLRSITQLCPLELLQKQPLPRQVPYHHYPPPIPPTNA